MNFVINCVLSGKKMNGWMDECEDDHISRRVHIVYISCRRGFI